MTCQRIVVTTFITMTLILSANSSQADETKVPEKFKVKVVTSKGNFVIEVMRKWSPNGADRFHDAVTKGFYSDCRFFRVVPNFMVQWGINGNPDIQKNWVDATIQDDPVVASNLRGFITYAKSGAPNSRSTQLFINFKDNSRLDSDGFSPFGRIVEGMDVVDSINAEYEEQPRQGLIQSQGNAYLNANFPNLDYIKSMTIMN